MSNFRLHFACFAQMPKKPKNEKFMLHNKAKKFVSLQVLKKNNFVFTLKKTAKCL